LILIVENVKIQFVSFFMKQELVLWLFSNWASTYVQLEITSNNKFEKNVFWLTLHILRFTKKISMQK